MYDASLDIILNEFSTRLDILGYVDVICKEMPDKQYDRRKEVKECQHAVIETFENNLSNANLFIELLMSKLVDQKSLFTVKIETFEVIEKLLQKHRNRPELGLLEHQFNEFYSLIFESVKLKADRLRIGRIFADWREKKKYLSLSLLDTIMEHLTNMMKPKPKKIGEVPATVTEKKNDPKVEKETNGGGVEPPSAVEKTRDINSSTVNTHVLLTCDVTFSSRIFMLAAGQGATRRQSWHAARYGHSAL